MYVCLAAPLGDLQDRSRHEGLQVHSRCKRRHLRGAWRAAENAVGSGALDVRPTDRGVLGADTKRPPDNGRGGDVALSGELCAFPILVFQTLSSGSLERDESGK